MSSYYARIFWAGLWSSSYAPAFGSGRTLGDIGIFPNKGTLQTRNGTSQKKSLHGKEGSWRGKDYQLISRTQVCKHVKHTWKTMPAPVNMDIPFSLLVPYSQST